MSSLVIFAESPLLPFSDIFFGKNFRFELLSEYIYTLQLLPWFDECLLKLPLYPKNKKKGVGPEKGQGHGQGQGEGQR